MFKRSILPALLVLAAALALAAAPADSEEGKVWGLSEKPQRAPRPAPPGSLLPPALVQLVPALGKLVGEIEYDRTQRDPLGLARSALRLDEVERQAGRRSGLSASDLLREAEVMARDQRNPAALKQILEIWNDPARGPYDPAEGEATARMLDQVEAERAEMLPRKRCQVVFDNRTGRSLEVALNEHSLGSVAPGARHVVPEVLAGRQHLSARDRDRLRWGPRRVFVGPGEVFYWKLFD